MLDYMILTIFTKRNTDVANVILDSSNNQKTQENMIIGSNGEARNRIVTTILTAIQVFFFFFLSIINLILFFNKNMT